MIRRNFFNLLVLLTISLLPTLVLAEEILAMITGVDGEVEVLSPAKKNEPTENQMSYEGKTYHFLAAKSGQKLSGDQILMSKANGKAKIIYKGGSIVLVGPNTFTSVVTEKKSGKEIALTYGKVRAVVDPAGDLAGLKIKTQTAVAGIRGTDLYVSYDPNNHKTKIETVRGSVDVSNFEQKTLAKVDAGQLIVVDRSSKSGKDLRTANQQDLAEIQLDSNLRPSSSSADSSTAETKAEIEQLEKSTQAFIIKDIARYDPKSAERLQAKNDNSTESLNTAALYSLFLKAPLAPDHAVKDDELYKKYFDSMGLQKDNLSQ